ncbi:MAG TPA: hypothetical protein VF806_08665 [Anaerolineaceae bacterium]
MHDHRRQMFWQVWLPLGVTIVIVLFLAVLSVIGAAQGSSQVERWGALSAVWVIIPVLIWGVVLLALVGGMAFGVTLLVRKMPGWMLRAQLLVIRIGLMVRRAADAATKPVVTANTVTTRAATLWDRIFHRRTAVR